MYNAPHSPLQAPEHLVQPYLEAGLSPGVATIYAMIEAMDNGIGRLLNALDDLHLAENTLVMFTSDNGPAFMHRPDQVPAGMARETMRFNCGFAGAKGSVYEGGIRVPMILRGPQLMAPAHKQDALIHFTDWFPTLLNLAGVPRPQGLPLDGHDISALLRGERLQEEPRRFWQFNIYFPVAGVNAAMRDGVWKLVYPQVNIPFASPADAALWARYTELDIEYKYHPERFSGIFTDMMPAQIMPTPAPPELYNIADDPLEQHNLAQQQPARLAQMRTALESWFEEVAAEGMATHGVSL
jgi:arylsulfatase A